MIQIKYNNTSKHNYYGCNLQNGDFHGVCFIFPLIIWYYFNKFYDKKRYVGARKTIIIPSVNEMLKQKNLDLFVKTCFLDFSQEFGKYLISSKNEFLNMFIEKKNTRLIKQILHKFICFITQPNIRKNIIST